MTIAPPQLHHLALTVRDLDAAIDWYGKVFGLAHFMDVPHEGGIGVGLADPKLECVIVLHRHDDTPDEPFHETRTGLDHVGLRVATRDDLVAWQDHLESNGVVRTTRADRPLTQSPIADEPYGSVLVFRDPDNIQLELIALE
ncbi:VOC family protein [Tenggerimyces flavus]|uniref:VOC family protein n=1 Tax=Tenggerimyces flavus TaxID=1708749 RepID=A0ABV7YIM8_9ACTN|nr:VOC family protein [Tenggerimyces flavus]MBM7790963.1 catechol 2,3-dioxygenase-like lactoylglutathione lyase family enzyme [Tenggerimyces flavus]